MKLHPVKVGALESHDLRTWDFNFISNSDKLNFDLKLFDFFY